MFRTVLILFLVAAALPAQGRLRAERPRPLLERREARREMKRDAIMSRIHQMRMNRLQRALGVNEDKAREIADRWAQFDLDSMERRQSMRRLREQVNSTLMGPGSEEEKNARLRPMIDQLAADQKVQQEAREKFESEIRGSLTPAQQGRFILLVEEFQRSLQEALAEQKREK
ncbi:MAG: hypothetical protein IPN59_14125 [Holophaga sp.]|nr:hypothetical protein [Holophaga sp.]